MENIVNLSARQNLHGVLGPEVLAQMRDCVSLKLYASNITPNNLVKLLKNAGKLESLDLQRVNLNLIGNSRWFPNI